MINSAALLVDLQRQLKVLQADLTARAEDSSSQWGARLSEEHRRAQARERTGLSWIDWRDGEVAQAAVAWILASVFIRFAEDNALLTGAKREGVAVALPWFAAPGDGLERAVENEAAFYAASPTSTSRDWLQEAFTTLADLPAGRPLVDPTHSAVWKAPISASAADGLRDFFRRTTPDGALVHDFSDPELGTRFLGDLYQDLSDYAKKTYALLQTPDFVEEFILDLTLTPAIAEFGLTGLKLIDPACGSGHFLLGAFDRLVHKWAEAAPGEDKGGRVQKALDSIHGVDLNPFAIAIARFRLTVAALKASGLSSLVGAPAFKYHLAIGDSLLGSVNPNAGLDLGDDEYFEYNAEDLREYAGILESGQYHVVVANPPYIQPPDAKLRDQYRALYKTCSGRYALSVPFMELLFRLAKRPDGTGSGYVGQITSNSFMKREFGKKLIEQFLSGAFTAMVPDYVDLSHVIDTSGAFIPGHGTPTAILIGRPRKPLSSHVRAVLGVRGEPGQPAFPAHGLVWRDIVEHFEEPGYEGLFVSVVDIPRATYSVFPWSLSGGGTGDLKNRIELASQLRLGSVARRLGVFGAIHADEAYIVPGHEAARRGDPSVYRELVAGELVRDWAARVGNSVFFPYSADHQLLPIENYPRTFKAMWPLRTELGNRATFSRGTYFSDGRSWYEWHQLPTDLDASGSQIAYAEVATHNSFVIEPAGKAFTQTAPVIKLPSGASEEDHYDLIGVLNSSTACFWLKQVSFNKGNGGIGGGIGDEAWEPRYQFNATKLVDFPLPHERERALARRSVETAKQRDHASPGALLARTRPSELGAAKSGWIARGQVMVALQEELDWRMYAAYGLASPELAPALPSVVPIEPNERAFEIGLARAIVSGEAETAWFVRHNRTPVTTLPESWPDWYRDLVERRLAETQSNPSLRILEQPEFKRRWAGASWDSLLGDAVREALLTRLEAPDLWKDRSGRPVARSAAQVADEVRHDETLRELLAIHSGTQDFELVAELEWLLDSGAVPAFAPLRYKAAGLEKFRAWEHTWELQRAEDRGERVEVPVPPKYGKEDFLKPSYWSARGKLDVPKERFIAFPGSRYPEDATATYGWAGWDHGERGQAIARFANDQARAGADDEQVIPLVGALIEIEPWLKQWHYEIDARSGVSPATAVAGIITSLLGRLGMGGDAVLAWRPPAPTRGRKSAS